MVTDKTRIISLYIVAMLFSGVCYFLQVLPMNSTSHFEKILSLSPSQTVTLTSLFLIAYAFMQIPIGILVDRFGIKLVVSISLSITILGSILYAVGTTILIVAIGRTLTGLGCAVAYLSGIFIAAKYLPLKRLPIFIGLVEAVSVWSVIIGTHVFKKIHTHYGWYMANFAIIIFCLILLILFLFLSRKIEHTPKKVHSNTRNLIKQAFSLLSNKTILAIFIYSFCTWLVFMSFAGYWIKLYMLHMYNYSEHDIKPLSGLYWGTFLIANILVGFCINTPKWTKITLMVLSVTGFLDFLYIASAHSLSNLGFVITITLAGISASGIVVAFAIITKIVSTELSGTALSINNTFAILGGYTGQVLFGYIVKQDYLPWVNGFMHKHIINVHYFSAFIIYPFFAFIGVITAVFIIQKPIRTAPP